MSITALETPMPDAEIAKELRAEARVHLDELCATMNRARVHGLTMGFNIGNDQYGRYVCPDISVVRPL